MDKKYKIFIGSILLFFIFISILLTVIAVSLNKLVIIKRADLKRELIMNSSVDCFSIKEVDEIINIKGARENCRKSIYFIEGMFGW